MGSMSIVEIDERFRLPLPKEVRESFKVTKGQKLYVIPAGDTLIIKRIPEDIPTKLEKIIGKFKFDRNARRKAEKWFLKQSRNQS
jgi:bifunctional DNA-binding transcriptional regulator/antitoxin component of YhaV-PrlF toxin-antitoxin module